MSSLAEINQQLMEQNKEQERTSVAIEDVRAAITAQLKEDRRSRLDEREAKIEAKRAKPQGFQQAFMRSSGLEGLGNFGTAFLAALFGAGSGLATALGTAAGGLIRLGPVALVLSDFVENAFKTLLNNIDDSVFTGFDLDVETKDKIANGAQTALAARFLGVKSPLGLLAAAVAGAYGDELIASLRGWFDKDGDGKIEKFGITLDTESKAVQEGIVLAAALAAPAMLRLVGKGLVWALKRSPVGRVGAALITGISTLFGFAKSATGAPIPEDSKAIDQKMSTDAKSTSADLQKKLASDYYKGLDDSMQAKQAAMSQRIAAENRAKTQATLRRLQNINAQPLDIAPKVSAAPSMAKFEEGSRVSYTRKDGSTVDATVTRSLPNQMTQLKFDRGGKIAVDTSRITPIEPKPIDTTKAVNEISKTINTEVPKITSAIDNGFQKATRLAGAVTIEGAIQEAAQYGAGKTGGVTSRLLSGVAKTIGSTAGLAASFVMGGLFENEAGDGTRSGVIDAQGYALMEAMANGENFSVIKEKRQDLFNIVTNPDFADMATPTHKALSMLTDSELLNLSGMVYAQANPGRIKGSRLGQTQAELSSAKFGRGRALYGEELNALDALAAERQAMGMSPVIIQDQSVRQGGNQTNVTNQIDTPIQSFDASWYQRRAAMGLGL